MNISYVICDNIFIQEKVLLNCLTSLLTNSTQELQRSVFKDLRRFYETNKICTLSSFKDTPNITCFLTGLAEVKLTFVPELGEYVDQLIFTELTHHKYGACDFKGYAINFGYNLYQDKDIDNRIFVNFVDFLDTILSFGVPIKSDFYKDLFSRIKDFKVVHRVYFKEHGVSQTLDNEFAVSELADFICQKAFIPDEHVKEGFSQAMSNSSNFDTFPKVNQNDAPVSKSVIEPKIQPNTSTPTSKRYSELTSLKEIRYQQIIGALVELLGEKRTQPYTQELVQTELDNKYGDKKPGFSKSHLQKLFAESKKSLAEN